MLMAAAGVRSLDLSASAALQGRATVLEPQNSRDLPLVSACFILPCLAFPFQDDPCPALAGLSFLAGGTNRRAAELL
jgi:hypothetical protein